MPSPEPLNATCVAPDEKSYPAAKIPLMPVLTYNGLGSAKTHNHSLVDLPHVLTSAGRAAIVLALEHAGIGHGDEVLVPAYHCESLIAPVEHVGAAPVFYRVGEDALVDLEHLKSKITPNTRGVLATHYFGFPQRTAELRAVCDRYGMVLIEDCAHAFVGSAGGQPLGSVGDYAIGSAMKFFPVFDGGLLASTKHDLTKLKMINPSLALEIKGLVSIIEYAMRYGRLRLISLPLKIAINLKDIIWGIAKQTSGGKLKKNFAPLSSEGGYALDPDWIYPRMSRVSEFILAYSRIDRIFEGRRAKYRRIVEALDGVPGIKPLFDDLPPGTAPLVVPMIMQDSEAVFPILKNAGVPIWRFGEYLYPQVNESICRNSVFLSSHVFQFPCHPDLTDKEIDWMVDTIKLVLTE